MSLFALITALLLEQIHPLSSRKYLFGLLSGYVNFFRQRFNAGQQRQGTIAWLLAVLPLLAGAIILYQLFYRASPILAWAFNVLVLYLTMGFRQSSHYFTDIHRALREGRLDDARRLLSDWRGKSSHELNAEEVARLTIEQALVASHRNVFGVVVWFVLFSAVGLGGAAGALLYRLGQFLRWHLEGEFEDPLSMHPDEAEMEDLVDGEWGRGEFGGFSRLAFYILDWLPVRLTAMTFAIVGNFEDAIYCWRTQANGWPDAETGILLSSGAGALGVHLGMPIQQGGLLLDRPELGIGDDADTGFMQSTVGLVWRSVVFWLILLMLLTFSNLVG
ncbi:MAG: CobD/CbiB family protein [Gallionella sp.]